MTIENRFIGKRVKILRGPAAGQTATCTSLVAEALPMIRLNLDDGTVDYWADPLNVAVLEG